MTRLGGLAGRVGASVLGSKLRALGKPESERQEIQLASLLNNASRVVETLGEMKGAAMKVGQMLSLHEGILPKEVLEVLRPLQGEAPRVEFETMLQQVRRELPQSEALFESIEPESFAAASIGQVHRGRLRDGRDVAVKIQYPDIDKVVRADLTNLRVLLKQLFELVSEADFNPIWEELREVLLSELDYRREADNIQEMSGLFAEVDRVTLPTVVPEASSQRVLTMEFVGGLSMSEALSGDYPQDLRDAWGQRLFELLFLGLFRHRLLHADPNVANFAFREDGGLVVYDLGCVKQVPEDLARGYARLLMAGIDRRPKQAPEILFEMGVLDECGGPLGRDLTDPYFEIGADVFRATPPYRFGEDETVYPRLMELGMDTWQQQMDVRFPKDILFIQRALTGHFGNLCRLRSTGPWRELAVGLARDAPGSPQPAGVAG